MGRSKVHSVYISLDRLAALLLRVESMSRADPLSIDRVVSALERREKGVFGFVDDIIDMAEERVEMHRQRQEKYRAAKEQSKAQSVTPVQPQTTPQKPPKQKQPKDMQNDAQHMQNDANTSNDVMLCSVLYSSDLNDLEKIEEENDTAREMKSNEREERQETRLESTIGNDPSKCIDASEIESTAAEKRQNSTIAGDKRQNSDRIGLFSQDFESWWSRYPKKTGKQAAFVAWKKTSGALPPIETMLSALDWQSQCQQWTKDGGQYVPNPATYINQMRWLDEPPQTQAQLIEQGRQSFEEYMMEQQRLKNGQH